MTCSDQWNRLEVAWHAGTYMKFQHLVDRGRKDLFRASLGYIKRSRPGCIKSKVAVSKKQKKERG